MKYFIVEGMLKDSSLINDDIMKKHMAYTQKAMDKGKSDAAATQEVGRKARQKFRADHNTDELLIQGQFGELLLFHFIQEGKKGIETGRSPVLFSDHPCCYRNHIYESSSDFYGNLGFSAPCGLPGSNHHYNNRIFNCGFQCLVSDK